MLVIKKITMFSNMKILAVLYNYAFDSLSKMQEAFVSLFSDS